MAGVRGGPGWHITPEYDGTDGWGRKSAIWNVHFAWFQPRHCRRHGALDGRSLWHTSAPIVCIPLYDRRWCIWPSIHSQVFYPSCTLLTFGGKIKEKKRKGKKRSDFPDVVTAKWWDARYKVCGCYLVCFFIFSNFLKLDLHKETSVALANLQWSISKNWIKNQTSHCLLIILGSACFFIP